MTTMFRLLNPKDYVDSAAIAYESVSGRWYLSVSTKLYGSKSDGYKSFFAAKMDFGKKFFAGAKWEKV